MAYELLANRLCLYDRNSSRHHHYGHYNIYPSRFMTVHKRTQLDRIIAILERDGCISNFYAIENRISLRLGARIQDLEDRGYTFRTERHGKNYVYHLVTTPAPKQLSLA